VVKKQMEAGEPDTQVNKSSVCQTVRLWVSWTLFV